MEQRTLGKTGLKVTMLGFGGIPIQRVPGPEAHKIIETCIEEGINFFDTARAYTDSEEKIGRAIRGKRGKVVLASKSMVRSAEKMAAEIDDSLKALGTEYIDLYQCHNVNKEEELNQILAPQGAVEALLKAQQAGKIGHIGITSHRVEPLLAAMNTGAFATIQLPYNFIERSPEEEVLPVARELGLGIIVMKPLAGGAFAKPDLALKFFLDKQVSSIIPGIDSLAQLEQNLGVVRSGQPLDGEELEYLTLEAERIGERFCRRCEYCQPCPQGIEIARCLIFHSYFERYGLQELAIERYRMMKQASDCVECGLCESRCPYGLPIREMLKKVHRDMGLRG